MYLCIERLKLNCFKAKLMNTHTTVYFVVDILIISVVISLILVVTVMFIILLAQLAELFI